jgi:lysophospholipase L1-like esterase
MTSETAKTPRGVALALCAAVCAAVLMIPLPVQAHSASYTAMSGNPCAGAASGAPGPSFRHMILHPGAHLRLPPQSAQQKASAQRAADRPRARDWADLCRYQAADQALKHRVRVVFMGDSITDFWQDAEPAFFTHGIVDRGISGQTSAQMLVRFWPDVIALHPNVVQILAGTNDIAGNTGPTTQRDYENDIRAMVTLAEAHHIHVIIGSMPPAVRFWWAPKYHPAAEIRRLNAWLRAYAARHHLRFVDYYAHLVSRSGRFRKSLSNDGVHPNRNGYKVMSALAHQALDAPWPHSALQRARR